VHASVLAILAARGYQALSVPDVAQRAGVHETSIYRRWGTKANLVSDVIISNTSEYVPAVDTGTFSTDMVTLLRKVVARLGTPFGNAVSQLVASQDPDLAALRSAYWESRLRVAAEIVERAKSRGELPRSVDPRLVMEMLSGPILLRLTSGKRVTARYIYEIVRRVTIGLQDAA
jgi:AcrR family transcriptional regulator